MSKWISCEDRLPSVTGVYPACSMHPQRTFEAESWIEMLYEFNADAKKGETPWQHGSGFYDGAITHWMDLPTAPDLANHTEEPLGVVEHQQPDFYMQSGKAELPDDWRGVIRNKYDPRNGYTVPLYTSPPAPVAMVLPDRKSLLTLAEEPDDQVRMLEQIERNGWNACLDRVKEMNK